MSKNEIDHYATAEMVCPYCGEEQDTADLFEFGNEGTWSCERCTKTFTFEVDWSPTFYTKEQAP